MGSPNSFCVTCDPGFYLSADQTQCLVQYIPNCVNYQPNINVCVLCGAGYRVDIAGSCVSQSTGIEHCIVQNGAACFSCDINFWPSADLNSCQAEAAFKILIPDAGGNYNYLTVTGGVLGNSIDFAVGDISDWAFNSLGNNQYRISTSDGQFNLIAQNGLLALEASSDTSNRSVWQTTHTANGNFLVMNVASNLYIVSPDSLGSSTTEVLFYATSSY
jgi:hypothetical protein